MCDISGCRKPGNIVVEFEGKHYALCQEHFEELSDILYAIALKKGEADFNDIKLSKARTKVKIEPAEKVDLGSLKQLEVKVYEHLGVSKDELGEVPQEKKRRKRRRKRRKRSAKKAK